MGDQLPLELGLGAPDEATLEALRDLLPGAFADGELSAEGLLATLGLSPRSAGAERYGFQWTGRAEALAAARARPTGALIPDRARSRAFDDAHHVLIEGDNLEVLRLLRPAYAGTVKAIILDPPYNTAHDLIYDDDFSDGVEAYLRKTGQVDEAGARRSSRAELDGRKHSRWLSMMAPRLELARSLLRDDGCIFVSIDHTESHHLRLLMNAVFGEENFVAQIAWQKRYTRANNTEKFTSVVDQILLYQRSSSFKANLLPRTDRDAVEFRNPDDDPRGPWKLTSFLNQVPPERRPNLTYPITNPNTGTVTENDRKAWRVNREGYERLLSDNRLWWGRDGSRPVPQVKTFLSEVRQGLTPTNFWSHEYAGTSDRAHDELKALFGRKIFDTPKPTLLIRRMLEHATGPGDLVLDFFAGSGTTAAAVMALNAEDEGGRRTILVQLPEPIEGAPDGELQTISDITRERVRRVGDSLSDALSEAARGYRVFRLGRSERFVWPENVADDALGEVLSRCAEGARPESEGGLLFEAILLAGLPLDSAIESQTVAGAVVHDVAAGALSVSLEATLDERFFAALAERRPKRVVVRDAAFQDDQARLRAVQILDRIGARLETL
jgi:adenine-specific DNA-methyltransferase